MLFAKSNNTPNPDDYINEMSLLLREFDTVESLMLDISQYPCTVENSFDLILQLEAINFAGSAIGRFVIPLLNHNFEMTLKQKQQFWLHARNEILRSPLKHQHLFIESYCQLIDSDDHSIGYLSEFNQIVNRICARLSQHVMALLFVQLDSYRRYLTVKRHFDRELANDQVFHDLLLTQHSYQELLSAIRHNGDKTNQSVAIDKLLLCEHASTWQQIKPLLGQFIKSQDHGCVITQLLVQDDAAFVAHVKDYSAEYEMAHLSCARLCDIVVHAKSSKLRGKAFNELKRLHGAIPGEEWNDLCRINVAALYHELYKMIIHAELYPDNKKIILGTSYHLVKELVLVKPFTPRPLYLNVNDADWSWQLNRWYIKAALYLGFELQLLEQASPAIEYSLKQTTPSTYLLHIVNSLVVQPINKSGEKKAHHSPYWFGKEQRFSFYMMECLYAKTLNTRLIRGEDNKNYLRQLSVKENKPLTLQYARLKRSSSCPDMGRSAKPPAALHESLSLEEAFTIGPNQTKAFVEKKLMIDKFR